MIFKILILVVIYYAVIWGIMVLVKVWFGGCQVRLGGINILCELLKYLFCRLGEINDFYFIAESIN
jgi:hypothetical protein